MTVWDFFFVFGNFLTRDLTETGTRVSKGAEGGGRESLKIVVVLLGKRNDLEMSTGPVRLKPFSYTLNMIVCDFFCYGVQFSGKVK